MVPTVELSWVKSLDLIYGTKDPRTKPHKVASVDGDRLHYELRCLENQERASRDHNGSVPNYVVAALTFVISDRPHVKNGAHGRRVVTVPIRYNNQATTHVTDVFLFDEVVKEKKSYKRSSKFTQQLLEDSPADKRPDIVLYKNKATNTFSDRYHHSERAFWGALRTDALVQQIASELLKKIDPLGLGTVGTKIYCAIFDFHSTRYLCHNCEPSSFEFQKPTGNFLERLQRVLGATCVFSQKRGITLLTRVSAEDEGGRKRPDTHAEFWRDRNIRQIRSQALNLVLQRDDRLTNASGVLEGQFGLFVSNQKLQPAQAVYIVARRDNPTTALELTSSNKAWLTHIAENEQHVRDILKEVRALWMQGGDLNRALELVEKAYQLAPDLIDVWCDYYEVLVRAKNFVGALEFALRVYNKSQDRRVANEWNKAFVKCYEEVMLALADGDAATFKRMKPLLIEREDDRVEFLLLRALYYQQKGEVAESQRNREKAFLQLDTETIKGYSELFMRARK